MIGSVRLFRLLCLAHLVIGALLLFFNREAVSGDHYTYIGLADGILQGRFSYWYFLEEFYPDTFRTPGYPLFLAGIRIVSEHPLLIKAVQLCLYYLSLVISVATILRKGFTHKMVNLFLILMIPNVQVLYYSTLILPESLMVFLVVSYLYVELVGFKGRVTTAIVTALLWTGIFYVRPIFLLFPFLIVTIKVGLNPSTNWKTHAAPLFLYLALLLPYGLWNKRHHNSFSILPLEGGGGVMHLGFWQHRLPGYVSDRYWNATYMGDELLSSFFVNKSEISSYREQYNHEWDYIDGQLSCLLAGKDSSRISQMRQFPELFVTHGSKYTMEREKLLRHIWLAHVIDEPWYFIKTRFYTSVRLFGTGVSRTELGRGTFLSFVKAVYPTVVTFCTFVIGGFLVAAALYRHRIGIAEFYVPIAIILYCWIIHVPMAIQSRYTIPVHLPFIFMICVAVYRRGEPSSSLLSAAREN